MGEMKIMQELRNQATEYFIAGNFEALHEVLGALVSEDDPWGMHYLAGALSRGIGVSIDLKAANQLYQKAAELGFADSQAVIGNNLIAGIGCTPDVTAGVSWLEKSSKQGHTYADFLLSRVYLNGIGVAQNRRLGIQYLEKSAFNGYSEAQRVLGGMKLVGRFCETNAKEGLVLLNNAVDQSNIEAMYDLGKIYEAGVYLEKDHSLAAKYLLMAAEGEHVKAMHDIGVLYFNGTGVPKDVAEANKWYLRAANRGSHLSSYCLGLNEENGENAQGRVSVPLAIVWYLIAQAQSEGGANESRDRVAKLKRSLSASEVETVIRYMTAFADDRQFPWAQLALGNMYLTGEFVTADKETAQKYFSFASANGIEVAERLLASPERTDDDIFNKAIALSEIGMYEDAFALLNSASNRGDPKAQYLSALMLESGVGTIQDIGRSRELYFSSAELGYSDSQAKVGGFYILGDGVDVDYEKAAFWFDKAAKQGNPIALNDLGNMFREGLFFERDESKAISLYKLAAEHGGDAGKLNFGRHLTLSEDPKEVSLGVALLEQAAANGLAKAQTTLALHYVEGGIVQKDLDRAFELFQAAAASGDLEGIVGLGMNYANGYGCEKDLARSVQLFEVAAKQGAAQAQFNLAWSYHYGQGVDRDLELALKWYSAAAEQGNPGAIRGVGEMYELGAGGLQQDLVKAAQLYERAAEMGDLVAQYNLGVFYEHGEGVPVSRRLAETYLELSANQGHNSAQLNLGLLYQSGVEGVPDFKKAIYWLQMAAESGNPKAHGAIGSMYLNGHGVNKDTAKAIHHFELSAARGEVYSQYNLALVLRGVNDGPVDQERSTYWLKQASESGFGPAQVDLSISYLKGTGVELDHAEAYKWALLSVSNGDERGEKLQSYCEDNINEEDLNIGRLRAASFRQST
jgi:TPR repeat protein